LTVSLVNEAAAHGSWSGVEVFVGTPDGEIDIPVVELEGHVSCCVSEIPAYEDVVFLGVSGDGGKVEELASVELDSWEEEKCCGVCVRVDGG